MSPKIGALILICVPYLLAGRGVDGLFAANNERIAKEHPTTPPENLNKPSPFVELKTGYFFFVADEMRSVYDHAGFDVQLAGSYPVYDFLSVYGAVEYVRKSGNSSEGDRTSIWLVPLSLGLQYSFPINKDKSARYYITLGPRYFFAGAHNHSSFFPKHMHANGLGAFLGTGFLWSFYNRLTFDFFGEYSYVRLAFHSSHTGTKGHTVQAGGLTFGVGFGYKF